jgi:hypothetical protein
LASLGLRKKKILVIGLRMASFGFQIGFESKREVYLVKRVAKYSRRGDVGDGVRQVEGETVV